jgi:hypothetical protein
MANSNQTSDNTRKNGDKAQRPNEADQQNQGGQRSHSDQQHQGQKDSGGGQQTGGSHGHDRDMNRKETSNK